MNYILEDIVDAITQYNDKLIDEVELSCALKEGYYMFTEKNNICPRCSCYNILKQWTEHHPYGESYAEEYWSGYYCPECGEDE